jgi:hypothetical protein
MVATTPAPWITDDRSLAVGVVEAVLETLRTAAVMGEAAVAAIDFDFEDAADAAEDAAADLAAASDATLDTFFAAAFDARLAHFK